MKKDTIENLSTEKLIKRKKMALALLLILFSLAAIDLGLLIYDYLNEKVLGTALFISAASCLVIASAIFMGKNKIEAELSNREQI